MFIRSALVGLALATGASAFSAGPALPTLSRTGVASATCLKMSTAAKAVNVRPQKSMLKQCSSPLSELPMTIAGVGGTPKYRQLGFSPTNLPPPPGSENYDAKAALGMKEDTDVSYAKPPSSFFASAAPKKAAAPMTKRAAPAANGKAAPKPAAKPAARGAPPAGRLGSTRR
ncbi:hypothetical protein T484DRAFT_2027210 [Baffinella frigidus]|nr:hypothetical protein T484DRAFT_2027210 [Cryptophyta sp. CCMP2293]